MLSKPTPALTANRRIKAQENRYCGNPDDWFDSPYFTDRGIYAASFDFFVNWRTETICDEVWIKRLSDTAEIQNQSAEELQKLIFDCDGQEKTVRLNRFLSSHNMIEKYMLFRDVPEQDWADGKEKVVELDYSHFGRGAVSYFNAQEIQNKIKALRILPAAIGSAGLRYSTSSLEGYLSKQPYFWPGDADTLLYDGSNHVRAILEFKKHTARSTIPFKDQKLSNYIERDKLKYKSLALLRDRFRTNLFVLYYPIQDDLRYIIVEKVAGNPDDLHAGSRYELKLPYIKGEYSMKAFTRKFIENVLQ